LATPHPDFEPSNAGIKIRCLNQLGDSPSGLPTCSIPKTNPVSNPARKQPRNQPRNAARNQPSNQTNNPARNQTSNAARNQTHNRIRVPRRPDLSRKGNQPPAALSSEPPPCTPNSNAAQARRAWRRKSKPAIPRTLVPRPHPGKARRCRS